MIERVRARSWSATVGLLLLMLPFAMSGCPKPPLPPPPKGVGGPATQSLAERDAKIDAVRANAVIRTRIPEGRPGAPGGKLTAIVLAAARPPRARIEVLTPFGTPAATLLVADGLFRAYDPFAHVVREAPLDSTRVAQMLGGIPLPLASVPDLMRGAVVFEPGEITESKLPAAPADASAAREARASAGGEPAASPDEKPEPESILVDVRREGRLVQQVRVHAEGGYPLEDLRFDPVSGVLRMKVTYSEYGGAPTKEGLVAFPQRITTRLYDEAGEQTASVEVRLSGIDLAPALSEDAFRLVFDRAPQVQEL